MERFKTSFLLSILSIVLGVVLSDTDLTIEIPTGAEECLFQPTKKAGVLEVEYQVIDGGDLDISFTVSTPSGVVLLQEHRQSDGVHKFNIQEQGDYKICLDNSYSNFYNKIVFLEVSTDDEEEKKPDDSLWETLEKDELVDMKIEDFREVLDKIKQRLEKSQQDQDHLRVWESKDRSIQEHNFERVNFFSGLQLFIMISVGLIQVLMVRSLFDDKSKTSQSFKART